MVYKSNYNQFELPPLPSITSPYTTKEDSNSNSNNNNNSNFFSILPFTTLNSKFNLPLLSLPNLLNDNDYGGENEGMEFLRGPNWKEDDVIQIEKDDIYKLDLQLEEDSTAAQSTVSNSIEVKLQEPTGRLSTWDSSIPGLIKREYNSPFLTESTESIYEAELSKLPSTSHSSNSTTSIPYTRNVMFENLIQVAQGFETNLFVWDSNKDQFDWRQDVNSKGKGKGKGREVVDDTDEFVGVKGRIWGSSIESSESLIRPFLTLGTYMVRLQSVVNTLTESNSTESSSSTSTSSYASHSLARALSTYLFWVRNQVTKLNTSSTTTSTETYTSVPGGLISLSTRLLPLLESSTSLSTIFNRQITFSPPYLHSIPLSTPSLLSLLYTNLQNHLNHSLTPPLMNQILSSWLLNKILIGWWKSWELWLGIFVEDELNNDESWMKRIGITVSKREKNGTYNGGMGEEEDLNPHFIYTLNVAEFPNFFPESIAIELFEAGKSLRLLRKAKPDHPLCQSLLIKGSGQGLLWKDGEVDLYQDAVQNKILSLRNQIASWRSSPTLLPSPLPIIQSESKVTEKSNLPEDLLSFLNLMDRTPGTKTIEELTSSEPIVTSEEQEMIDFFYTFLHSTQTYTILPITVPSLDILLHNSLFTPLRTFARLPSTCLLTLFFTDLSLQSHLSILHSYFLLGSQTFSLQLRSTLFTAPEEKLGNTLRRRRKRDEILYGEKLEGNELSKERENWGIGIGLFINGRKEKWGNGGIQLSLILRTCLDESILQIKFESQRDRIGQGRTKREKEKKLIEMKVLDQVEENLSFALKVAEEGQESRWADPHSLAAFDFLYLDYKTSIPLDILLTPDILTKYNDIFSHILRLLRIESVVRCIWTDISKPNSPTTLSGKTSLAYPKRYLLDSDLEIRKELLMFGFEIRSLVNNLLSYSFDSIIEGNYRAFRKSMDKIEKDCLDRERRGQKDTTTTTTTTESIDYNIEFEDDGESIYTLESVHLLHHNFLDKLQKGLFLKKKQIPLLKVIEIGIFGTIMILGRKLREWRRIEGTVEWNRDEVKKEVRKLQSDLRNQVVVLVNVLTALGERGGNSLSSKKKRGMERTIPTPMIPKELDISADRGGEESYIQELLIRLDANKFYSGREERR